MPFFRFPYIYNPNYYNNFRPNYNSNSKIKENNNHNEEQKNTNLHEEEKYFFELFGLKLYFDDILLICLLLFLYQEGNKDEELFLSLIFLLLN